LAKILTGTASWTDPTLLQSTWYPEEATTPEARLKFYASNFPLVEVDSSYYGLPAENTAKLWAERTPDQFTFDFKAFRLFTGHQTPMKNLPKAVREQLPDHLRERKQVYAKDLPEEVVDNVWNMYRSALLPLHEAGKLGAIFLQFPKWVFFNRYNLRTIARARERIPDYRMAVEFRESSWMNEQNAPKTLDFLREHGIAYTSVDEPQGTRASIPPIAASTNPDLSVVRFHGRRQETWDKSGVGVLERFRYLYDESELIEWVPKIKELAEESKEVHVLMNNCYSDYSVRNARQLSLLLESAGAPVATA
jgi:uncharacterized protein YecE (DUF72 family)